MGDNILRSGNRVLFKKTGDPPFFWIGFLDDALVSGAQNGMVSLTKQVFEKNAKRTWTFITKEFPDVLGFYMDCVRFMRKNFNSGRKIVLEIPILREAKGRERVKKELAAITEGRVADLTFLNPEDSPYVHMGSPMHDSFIKFSTTYQNYLNAPKKDKPLKFNRSLFIQFIALFVSNIILTGMILSSVFANGISNVLAAMAVVNFITYFYSASRIRAQWKLYQAAGPDDAPMTKEEKVAQEYQMQLFEDDRLFEDEEQVNMEELLKK